MGEHQVLIAHRLQGVGGGRRGSASGRGDPGDPGVAELADILEAAATNAPDHPGTPGHSPRTLLAGAVEDLRAAARLGGLLPAVTLWHLQRAIDQEHTAHQQTAPALRPAQNPHL